MVDTMGRIGVSSLWILGGPYIRGGVEYRGIRKSHNLWSRCPWLRRRLRVSAILFCTFTVGSLGRGRYWSSCRIALILVSYYVLSITTVALPLSAGTMTMLESFLRARTALRCLKDMLGLGGLAFLSTSAMSVPRVSAVF